VSKKKRTVLLASITLLLCVSLFAAGTYALFTDTVTLTNHLQAGTLDITLKRTNLTSKTVNPETGFLVSREFPDDVDFSKANDKNVFEIKSDELIVPGCEWNAEMQISNATDVAFGYWIEIDFLEGSDLLAKQLKVAVLPQGASEASESWVFDNSMVGSETAPVSVLAKGASQLFTVKVVFVDDRTAGVDFNNNETMGGKVKFDLIVHAVQINQVP